MTAFDDSTASPSGRGRGPTDPARIVFACEDRSAVLLGGFDGRDRRTLSAHVVSSRPEQLLVSVHEQLHEELQWSTAWGLTAAMAGLLARAAVRPESLSAVAELMNGAGRGVHERFATTISSGVIGVDQAQVLLADNPLYLSYLNDGLALGGPDDRWPWQFRESAIQMLLRALMQPAELADVASRGFGRLSVADIAVEHTQPDRRLMLIRDRAATWWEQTFTSVLGDHPERGGDTGGSWARNLPNDVDAMEHLKAWEEAVLIPALADTAHRELKAVGIAVLGQNEYLDVVEALRASFLQLAPEDWQVELFVERRHLQEEMLGAEREAILLADGPAHADICEADDLPARADEFLLPGSDGPHVLALLSDREVLRHQFAGLDAIPVSGPPLLALVGPASNELSPRRVPIALMRPDLTVQALSAMFSSLPVLTLSTLRASLDTGARDQLLASDEAFVLVDLPLRTQVASWIEQAGRVRLRVCDVTGATPMNLIVLQVETIPSLWMLSFRSDAGIGEVAQLLDRYPGQLTTDLDIPTPVVHRIGMLTAWLHQAWWTLAETPSSPW